MVSPDASLVRLDRLEALSAEERRRFAPVCPDLVLATQVLPLLLRASVFVACGSRKEARHDRVSIGLRIWVEFPGTLRHGSAERGCLG